MDLNKLHFVQRFRQDQWEEEYKKAHPPNPIFEALEALANHRHVQTPDVIMMNPRDMKEFQKLFYGPPKVKIRKRKRKKLANKL